jgi:glycosyltransferase involved in cell wall biosynthesis
MLEAMALGVPLVATPVCRQGLEIEAGKHLLIADGPLQFGLAIESLLDNLPFREKLVREARAYVERQHDWAESARALLAAYGAVMSDFTARPHRFKSDAAVSADQTPQPAA